MKFLSEIPLIGILRGAETRAVEAAVAAAVEAGLRSLEITLNRPEACEQIRTLKAKYAGELELGAGTVLSVAAAEKALAAGAEFIVTPVLLPEVISLCRERGVPVFPGAMSPTEIFSAWRGGATMVKVFPASLLGPSYLRSLRGPFPDLLLLPTGGITVENVPHYFQAGAAALGVGGELFKKKWLERGEWTKIKDKAAEYVQAVRSWRKNFSAASPAL